MTKINIKNTMEPTTTQPEGAPVSACAVVARPLAHRAKEYHAWRERLDADPSCWKFSEREDAIAFAAFIAGWWLRTGEDPNLFFNPPNEQTK